MPVTGWVDIAEPVVDSDRSTELLFALVVLKSRLLSQPSKLNVAVPAYRERHAAVELLLLVVGVLDVLVVGASVAASCSPVRTSNVVQAFH